MARRGYRLVLDQKTGTIKSFQSSFGVNRELLIPNQTSLPLFKIEFMDDHHTFKTVTSSEAQRVETAQTHDARGETVMIEFKSLAQMPLDARVTIRCPENESLTYWSLELDNRTDLWIGHIQFPVIEVPFDSPTAKNTSHILWPFADGMLAGPVEPTMLVGDSVARANTTRPSFGASITIPASGRRCS